MAALSTSIILRPLLLAVLLVDAAEAAENLKRRGEFLSSRAPHGPRVALATLSPSGRRHPLRIRVRQCPQF